MATNKVRDYGKLAADIKDALGESNITGATHCATRLRLVLKESPSAEVTQRISAMPGVIQVVEKGGQYQIVIGTHAKDVYEELAKLMKLTDSSDGNGPKQSIVNRIIATMSGCIAPFVYILAASGLVQGLLIVIKLFAPSFADTGTCAVLDFISWTPFTFLPVMLGIAASRHFKCNTYIAAWCCLALVNNSWADIAARIAGGETVKFLLFPMTKTTYTSTVLPPIILVAVLAVLERWLEKHLPDVVKAIGTPFLCAIIMVPTTILVIGPVAAGAANIIAEGYNRLYDFLPWLASSILGGVWQILVVFGVHWGISPIQIANFDTLGYDTTQATCAIAVCAQTAAAFGVFLKSRNREVKNVAVSAATTGLFGISEPAIYGVTLRFKKPFICACVSAAIGAAVASFFGTRYFVFAGLPNFLTVVNAIDTTGQYPNSFLGLLIGTAVACGLAILLVQIVGFDDPVPETTEDTNQVGGGGSVVSEPASAGAITLYAPMNGEIRPNSEVNDPTFAEGILGTGAAIIPAEGKLYAPFDCTVFGVADSKHAINLEADGIELLIHIGLDTVELGGKCYEPKVKDGDAVKAGDLLIEFDLEEIKKKYDTITPVLVTNAEDFAAVELLKASGNVKVGEPIITVKR